MERGELEHFQALRALLGRAHAPYSRFRVAARLLCEDGDVVEGCNVENASFGLSLCAERVALFRALARGKDRFLRLYVLSSGRSPVTPCGACREVLARLCPGLELVLFGSRPEDTVRCTIQDLLPR
jgi:cytidine deaminase